MIYLLFAYINVLFIFIFLIICKYNNNINSDNSNIYEFPNNIIIYSS